MHHNSVGQLGFECVYAAAMVDKHVLSQQAGPGCCKDTHKCVLPPSGTPAVCVLLTARSSFCHQPVDDFDNDPLVLVVACAGALHLLSIPACRNPLTGQHTCSEVLACRIMHCCS